jgi:hypothetical protein
MATLQRTHAGASADLLKVASNTLIQHTEAAHVPALAA